MCQITVVWVSGGGGGAVGRGGAVEGGGGSGSGEVPAVASQGCGDLFGGHGESAMHVRLVRFCCAWGVRGGR